MTVTRNERPFFFTMVTLKKLTYQGFRGQSREIHFNDGTTIISSRNGGGKTTVMNAFIFLLSGYDSDNKSNYNLFDSRETYSPDNVGYLSVEGEFDVDGLPMRLCRKAHQVWTMADTGEYVRTNDVYEYYQDGISVSATKYKQVVESIFGKGEQLKYMINVAYYRLRDDWKELRKSLGVMAGEITLSDMKGDYSDIVELLKKKDAESIRKSCMATITELEGAKKVHEVQIKTYNESMPKLSDIEDAENEVHKLTEERSSLEDKIKALVGQNDVYVEKRKQDEAAISAKRKQMMEAKEAHERAQQEKVKEVEKSICDAQAFNNERDIKTRAIRSNIASYSDVINSMENLLKNLREENLRIKSRVFDSKCPVCGQEFVGSTRDEKIAKFNERKAADLSANIELGISKKKQLEDYKIQVANWEKELEGLKEEKDLTTLQKKLYDVRKSFLPFDDTSYMEEINRMESEKTDIPNIIETEAMQVRIGDINCRIKDIMDNSPRRYDLNKCRDKIAMLSEELITINKTIVDNRKLKSKVESYQREYADIIKQRVNVNFENVNIVMTQYNKSGVLEDCCLLEYNGVTGSNNYAARILIGVELSKAFQKYNEVCLPIFIDNAESLNECNIPSHNGQIILLKVSETDFEVK